MTSSTVPLQLEHNRPYVDLTFRRPDGSVRTARCLVDTGGGPFLLSESLARELGLEPIGEPQATGSVAYARIGTPDVRLGDLALRLDPARCRAVLGVDMLAPGFSYEAFLPAHVLRQYHVIFDYPAGWFTVAEPGSIQPRGTAVAAPMHLGTGWPRIDVEIGGETHGFLLDTGASCTMVSGAVMRRWIQPPFGYPWCRGAYGAANMGLRWDAQFAMMRLPGLRWGSAAGEGVGIVSREEGTFERMMSGGMTAPIVGALAGNFLRAVRIELDPPAGLAYLEQPQQPDPSDLDMVGLTLLPEADGAFSVLGTAPSCPPGVQPGDRLLAVDQTAVTGLPLPRVVDLLRGRPGETRTLTLRRDGVCLTVTAQVVTVL